MNASSAPRSAPRAPLAAFEWFLRSEIAGSVALLACTVVALVWANSPWSSVYYDLLHTKVGVSWGDVSFALSVQHWINDGLMVIFFFVVGLEIKRELLIGHLSSMDRAVLPVMAALGGMLVPAGIYAALNFSGEGYRGWGVPMATDIAFSLGMLAVLGPRVPTALKVLLTAAAIADDLGAVLVIAVFYTEALRADCLLAAVLLLGALCFVMRVLKVRRLDVLLLLMIGVWLAVFASGIHATIAGVLVALLVPVRPEGEPRGLADLAAQRVERLRDAGLTADSIVLHHGQREAAEELEAAARQMQPAGLRFEHYWHPVQAFFILPLFALANAGVALDRNSLQAVTSPVALGVILGLLVGKPLGFTAFAALAIRTGLAKLPKEVTRLQFIGMSCLAGIGFTMALFVSELAFTTDALRADAKIGILVASLISAVAGYVVLRGALPPRKP